MIGYYVHHHGLGHRQRALAIARELGDLGGSLTGLSSLPAPEGWPGPWLRLPRDDEGPRPAADPSAGGVLHWAPLHDPGLRARSAAVARWAEQAAPRLLVSDVSVEIALLARLLGVPVAVTAMAGDRDDRPHATAYDLATALLAPWPAGHDDLAWPAAWRAKTWHTGAFSRFDGRPVPPAEPPAGGRRVLMLWGAGGSDVSAADRAAARAATPGWTWTYRLGTGDPTDVWPDLHAADVVVVHGGQNAVAEVAAARRPAVVVAQRRPHREQEARAGTLDRAGLAVGLPGWPRAAAWPGLLERARALGGEGWKAWAPGDGAARAAAAVRAIAAGERVPAADR